MEAMDSDDEMVFTTLTQEEAIVAAADNDEHLMMISCIWVLYTNDAYPRHEGSPLGRCMSNPRHRIEDHCIDLYANYFTADPLHGEVIFQCRFRMSHMISLGLSMPSGSSSPISYARRNVAVWLLFVTVEVH
jgi:hypothetical protein